MRASEQRRLTTTNPLQEYDREHGGGTVGILCIRRLKLEYQAARSLSACIIGERFTESVLDLRDDAFFVKARYRFQRQGRTRPPPSPASRMYFYIVLPGTQHACRLMAHGAWAA